MQRLFMITGVQRSGTTALFESFSTAPGITAYEESLDSEIYDDYFLRPEPEIRSLLHAAPGDILLKPVRESERYSVETVFAQYADYDLTVLWLYRDPVNVLYSWERQGWTDPQQILEHAYHQWLPRNHRILEVLPTYRDRLLILRYEDLLVDPTLLDALTRWLNLQIISVLRTDSNSGRHKMPDYLQKEIDLITCKTVALLDQARVIVTGRDMAVSPEADKPEPIGRRALLPRRLLSPLRRAAVQAATPATLVIPTFAVKTIVDQPDPFSLSFQRDPYACFRDWREKGAIHYLPLQKLWLVLSYDEVAAVLGDDHRFAVLPGDETEPPQSFAEQAQTQEAVSALIGERSRESALALATEMEDQACSLLADFCRRRTFDWVEYCYEVTTTLCSLWLGLPPAYSSQAIDGLSQQSKRKPTLDDIISALCKTEVLRQVAVDRGWSLDTIRRLLFAVSPVPYWVTQTVTRGLHRLLQQPDWMTVVRQGVDPFPGLIDELIRLTFPFLTVGRHVVCDVEIAGQQVAAGSLLILGIGAANRDPDKFDIPDEFRPHRSPPGPILFAGHSSPIMDTSLPKVVSECIFRALLTEQSLFELTPHTEAVERFRYHRGSFYYDCPAMDITVV